MHLYCAHFEHCKIEHNNIITHGDNKNTTYQQKNYQNFEA